MELYPLPPGVQAETFTCASGKQETIYRAPFERDGPTVFTEDGHKVLAYMYAAYVFRWRQNATKLDIGHGSIRDHMDLWYDVPINGAWTPGTLVRFATRWTHLEFSRTGVNPT